MLIFPYYQMYWVFTSCTSTLSSSTWFKHHSALTFFNYIVLENIWKKMVSYFHLFIQCFKSWKDRLEGMYLWAVKSLLRSIVSKSLKDEAVRCPSIYLNAIIWSSGNESRLAIWKQLVIHPHLTFGNMGNRNYNLWNIPARCHLNPAVSSGLVDE